MSSPAASPPSLSEHLQTVTETLAAAQTQEDVFGVVLTPALTALNAVAGAVLLVDGTGRRLETAATQGYAAGAQTLWQDGPLDGNVPAGDALERHEGLFFEHQGDLTRAYPGLEARTGGVAAVATAVLPMFLDGRALGTVILDFEEPHHFTGEERRFLRTLASQCAVALGRVRSLAQLRRELGRRQRTERGLRQSEARFRRMVEASPVAIAAGDLSGQLTLVNDAYLRLLGCTRAEFAAGRIDWASLTPPEYREADERAFARALGGGASEPYEKEMLTKTGERVPLHVVLIRYEDGEQSLVVGYLQDLRLQRAAERVLREQSAELERQVAVRTQQLEEQVRAQEAFVAFAEAVGTETDVITLAGRAVDVLQTHFVEGTGGYYEREGELWRLRTWTSTLNARPDLIAALRAGLPAETPFIAQLLRERAPVFTGGGDHATVAAYPVTLGGEVCGFFTVELGTGARWAERDRAVFRAVGRGLTLALERAEQARQLQARNAELGARTRALEAFEEWTRDLTLGAEPGALIGRAQDLLLDLLPVQVALYYEREGERWVVRSLRGEYGSDGLRLAHEAGLPHDVTGNLRIPFQTGETYYQDTYDHATDRLADQMAHVTATAIVPLRTGPGIRGLLGLGRFGQTHWTRPERAIIETVRRSLELALDRADRLAELARERSALSARTTELAAANEELEAFSYSVSHDLRTPVRHVLGFNQLLGRHLGEGLDAKATRYLQVVDEAAGRMNTLIDAMLDLSRTSRLPLNLGPVDLGELVRAVRLELEPELQTRAVTWEVGPLPQVTADRDILRQVVVNLLENALKYTRTREAARIEVWAEERPGEWVILVRDNGVGFDPQYVNKLFGVFQRLHLSKDFEGTGVGLANVRRIINRHGGQVHAEGRPGEGATFSFTLPRG